MKLERQGLFKVDREDKLVHGAILPVLWHEPDYAELLQVFQEPLGLFLHKERA